MSFTAMVITISDRCAQGQREDASGPLARAAAAARRVYDTDTAIVPDEYDVICHALRQAALANTALILTTGGTGFSPGISRQRPRRRCASAWPRHRRGNAGRLSAHHTRGMLSRATAGLLDRSLIVNLPGSPKAAQENLEAVLPSLAHGLEMLRGGQADCATLN